MSPWTRFRVLLTKKFRKKILRLKPQYDERYSSSFWGLKDRRICFIQNKLWFLLHTFKSFIPFLNSTDFDYSGSRFSWLHFKTLSLSFRRKSPTYEFARFARLHSTENPLSMTVNILRHSEVLKRPKNLSEIISKIQ